MSVTDRVLTALDRVFPVKEASAHCDIPCGIYDPHGAEVAALTVIRMYQLMQNLPRPDAGAAKEQWDTYNMQIARYTLVKEQHADLCKKEILILWTDYFKPEHLEQYPDLHDLVWKTTKLGSKVKQEFNPQAAQELLANVQRIAQIFWATKGADVRRTPTLMPAGGEYVYPQPK